jgi:hypothetical protein
MYHYGKSTYKITVFQLKTNEESWWKEKDNQGKGNTVPLIDDGQEHLIEVYIRLNFTS